jgi:hypothetical protein
MARGVSSSFAIRGSFGQGHSGVPGRCGEWLAANSEYVGRGQPLARLISSARVTQNATALFRAILGNREGTPWRNFEDGVEHSQIAIARLNGDINDIPLREQRLQAADDPTAGVQRQALGVEVDANEVPGAVGKFENEASDRYAVVVELALNDCPAEGAWVTRRIAVEVRYRHHSVAGGFELERWFCLGDTDASNKERGNQA